VYNYSEQIQAELELQYTFLYERSADPLGKSWQEWAAKWCKWMLSIPMDKNPTADETGKYCSMNQNDEKVWFLTGTFGNIIPFKRECTIPAGKAIFFPVIMKEDSLADDPDLKEVDELCVRCGDAMNRVVQMQATIDGQTVDKEYLDKNFRVQSEVFNLTFPEDNVYGVRPGPTTGVCEGYWLFLKPLEIGKHNIYFKGETSLKEPHTKAHLIRGEAHRRIQHHIKEKETFILDVSYELTII
jgi:hypothetical protein